MTPVALRVADLLEGIGLPVERHPVPADLVRAQGMMSCTNLVARQRFGDGPTIALSVHGDVVPPGEGWSTDPYGAALRDGWLYGRGAAVSKSDIASYATAMLALTDTPPAGGTVELHVTFDEETGGEIGPAWLLAQGITRPDAAIAAGFSYAVTIAHNGVVHLEVTVRGRSAHAAKPSTGADALVAATAILRALYDSRAALADRVSKFEGIGSPQLTVGLIHGGINTNVVPDRVVLRLDRRVTPEERVDEVVAGLRALIEGAASGTGCTVTVQTILRAEPLVPLPGATRLAAALCRHATAVFATPVATVGAPLYTDARHYAAAGVPVVLYGAGPRTLEEANAHRADERVRLSDLHGAAEVLTRSLGELLATGGVERAFEAHGR